LPIPPPAKRPGRRPQAHHAPSRRRRHPRHFNAPSLEEAREQLENLNKQIRRRTKVVSLFPNKESGLRLIASILMESSDDWESGRSSLNPGHLSSQNNQTETQTINLMRIDTFTEKKLRCHPWSAGSFFCSEASFCALLASGECSCVLRPFLLDVEWSNANFNAALALAL
jgi:hypothetical protein